jgi:DNA polymerase-1
MSKTYIVDGNSLLFRAYYSTAYTGNIMTTTNNIPINAIFAFHNLIKKIKSQLKTGDHLFVAFDTGKPTLRKKEFQDYKAQRIAPPDELIAQMPIAREMLEAMNIHWSELEGYEGDDLAGSMAKYASAKDDEVRLFTSDKDFLQLLSIKDNVVVEMLKKGLSETISYTSANLKEGFGLNPDQITDYKGMAGDPSDNYKGIKGCGEKTAMKLLNEHGHLEDIIKYCKENPGPKINQRIVEGEKDAIFSKQLATIITDMDMKKDYEESIYRPYDKTVLTKFYLKYQLSQFLRNIDKLPDIVDSSSSTQLSLFEESATVQEDEAKSSSFNERKTINIDSLLEIKEKILGITFDSSTDNENIASLYGFVLATENSLYFLKTEKAKNDQAFKDFLAKENQDIAVYDLKSLDVLLYRNGFGFIQSASFDLLLATYLINPDSGQKKESLFLSYGVSLDKDKNQAGQVISNTVDLRKQVETDLEKNEETKLFQEVEMPLSVVLAKMEIEGFPIDKDTLEEINIEYQNILSSLEREIYQKAGEEFNINSPKKLEEVLFTDLKIPKNKGEKGTGIDVLLAHQEDHPVIPLIIKYRLYNKLVSSYTSALPKHISSDNKIHAIYNQALTSTGRLSMSEPNLQNISIRNEEGKNIRKAFFYPNHEFLLLSLDYSQIELRVLAHVGNIKALQEIFKEGKDIHKATASKVFGVPIDEVTPEMRRRAKAVNFGIVYGISAFGLSEQLDIPRAEASDLIKQFKAAFEGIDEYQNKCIEDARKQGYVTTIMNRRRYLKDINSSNRALRSFCERAAVNTTIQGSAADLIKVAMVKCDQALKGFKTKIILQIHDELLFKVPKDELEKVEPILKDCMEHAMKLSVPLKVDGDAKDNWYEAH